MTKSSKHDRVKLNKNQSNIARCSDASRAHIFRLIENFNQSHHQSYSFEASLTNIERAFVHDQARKIGYTTKSVGIGEERRVIVYKGGKKKRKAALIEEGKTGPLFDKSKLESEQVTLVAFPEESKRILMDVFTHYPPGGPGEDETLKHKLFKDIKIKRKRRGRVGEIFRKPSMNKGEIAKKIESLSDKVKRTPKLKEIFEKKSKLPIASFQDFITSTIAANQVVLLSGETGCGKTTQVPQFLLDYMWAKGEACKIICTQPRRISAMSVAERISNERGEEIGDSVGYQIRNESKGGKRSSILFCTNGVLLRVLVSMGAYGSQSTTIGISELTHIIVDEIHERDRFSDFILAILRDILPAYPHLHLVMMSATLDAERFSQYFGGCPIIRIPGFTHPVKTFYLEDVLSMLKTEKKHLNATTSICPSEELNLSKDYQAAMDDAIEMANSAEDYDPLIKLISSLETPKSLNFQHSSTGVTPLMVLAAKGRVGDVCTILSLGADCSIQARDGSTALDWATREDQSEAAEIIKKHMESTTSSLVGEQQLLENYMSRTNSDFVDFVLIVKLLREICSESKDGAILVFLPGWDDINKTRDRLLGNAFFQDPSKFLILSLHSMVPAAEQKNVFKQPPRGCRKIVLSTNIAESSVTIDDVVYVIDSGRMKEKSYDPYSNVSTLQSSWISQASAQQREGRAGRCQPGFCYHLYSKLKSVSLPAFQVPEIKRMPIEELCLQVKMTDPNGNIEEFLNKTLDPPVHETIKNAIAVLQDIGVLSLDEQLTELGEKLGSLPVHPSISKMLFVAVLLNCLDPALTFACAADYKDPFTLPILPGEKAKAEAAKGELASLYGGYSDQLAVIAAFECWRSAENNVQQSRFCSQYSVSSSTMRMLSAMRLQLQRELNNCGIIPDDVSTCSMNARDPGIVRAVIVAGLYPMVGKLQRRGQRLLVETANSNIVRLHPSSVVSKAPKLKLNEFPLLVYDEVTRGDDGLRTRNGTVISPLPLLLLATEIAVAPVKDRNNKDDDSRSNVDLDKAEAEMEIDKSSKQGGDVAEMEIDKSSKQGDVAEIEIDSSSKLGGQVMSSPDDSVSVVVDRWLVFKSTALEVAQIYCLRERLSAAVLFKVSNSRELLPPALGACIYAIACLLSYDGLSDMSLANKSVETLTSMVSATEIGKSSSGEETEPGPSSLVKSQNEQSSSTKSVPSNGKKTPKKVVKKERHQRDQTSSTVAAGAGLMLVDPHVTSAQASSPMAAPSMPMLENPPVSAEKAEPGPSSLVKSQNEQSLTTQNVPSNGIKPPKKVGKKERRQRDQTSSPVAATTGVMLMDPHVTSAQASSLVAAPSMPMLENPTVSGEKTEPGPSSLVKSQNEQSLSTPNVPSNCSKPSKKVGKKERHQRDQTSSSVASKTGLMLVDPHVTSAQASSLVAAPFMPMLDNAPVSGEKTKQGPSSLVKSQNKQRLSNLNFPSNGSKLPKKVGWKKCRQPDQTSSPVAARTESMLVDPHVTSAQASSPVAAPSNPMLDNPPVSGEKNEQGPSSLVKPQNKQRLSNVNVPSNGNKPPKKVGRKKCCQPDQISSPMTAQTGLMLVDSHVTSAQASSPVAARTDPMLVDAPVTSAQASSPVVAQTGSMLVDPHMSSAQASSPVAQP